jgi:hypothetical protein
MSALLAVGGLPLWLLLRAAGHSLGPGGLVLLVIVVVVIQLALRRRSRGW